MSVVKKVLRYGTILAFMAAFFYFLKVESFDFEKVKAIDVKYLLTIASLYCMTLVVSGLFTQEILKVFNVSMSVRKFFHLTVVSSLFNLILPAKAGSGLKAVYLKRVCGLNYSLFLSNMAGTYVINFLVLSFVGLLAGLGIYLELGSYDFLTLGFLLLCFLGLLLAILFSSKIKLPTVNYKWVNLVLKVLNGWTEIGHSPRRVLKLSILTFFNTVLNVSMMMLCLGAMGIQSNIYEIAYISIIGNFASLLNITPGGIGVVEGMMIFVSRNLSIGISDVLIMSVLVRVITLISTTIIFPFSISKLYEGSFREKVRKAIQQPGESF